MNKLAIREITKIIIICSAFLSFITLFWFGFDYESFYFWQDFVGFICAVVIGLIPNKSLGNIRFIFVVTITCIIWIATKVWGGWYIYIDVFNSNKNLDISENILAFSSLFMVVIVAIHLYSILSVRKK